MNLPEGKIEKSTFIKLFSSVETHKPLLHSSFAFDGFLFFMVSKPKNNLGDAAVRAAHTLPLCAS
jgi:hypothetical protein